MGSWKVINFVWLALFILQWVWIVVTGSLWEVFRESKSPVSFSAPYILELTWVSKWVCRAWMKPSELSFNLWHDTIKQAWDLWPYVSFLGARNGSCSIISAPCDFLVTFCIFFWFLFIFYISFSFLKSMSSFLSFLFYDNLWFLLLYFFPSKSVFPYFLQHIDPKLLLLIFKYPIIRSYILLHR